MSRLKRIDAEYEKALRIILNEDSKIVMMSDIHRGIGNQGDNFAKNRTVYQAALLHYYREGFQYIELGDGDELWENKRMQDITTAHSDIFRLLRRFYLAGRLMMLWGNHDIEKGRHPEILSTYEPILGRKPRPLLPNLPVHEGVVLKWKDSPHEILLIHGHQADFFNDALWPLARFLVRKLWRPLELLGVKDPTSAAKSRRLKDKVEDVLRQWTKERRVALVAGHTHRAVMPKPGEVPYFNDGCCVHLLSITALEISQGRITLVQWLRKARADGTVYIAREILGGPVPIERFFKAAGYAAEGA
jgi:UDP-2,3-diacylglucosamine pyrophosphatase LpxH